MTRRYKTVVRADRKPLAAADLSFEQIRAMIQDQLAERFGRGEYGFRCWVRELFLDFALVEKEGKLYRAPYSVNGTDVTVGELEEVLPEYIPVDSSSADLAATHRYIETAMAAAAQSADPQGLVWECIMLAAGPAEVYDPKSGLPFYFTPEFLTAAVTAFEGVHAYEDHDKNLVGQMRKFVGFWSNVTADGKAMKGRLNLLESEEQLIKKIRSAAKAGRPNLIGVSIHAIVEGEVRTIAGKKFFVPTKVDTSMPRSADLVPVPGAGGYVLRAVASNNRADLLKEVLRQPEAPQNSAGAGGGTPKKEEYPMNWKQLIVVMLAAIRGWAADRAAALETELKAMAEDDSNKLEKVTSVYIECMNGQFARFNASAGEGVLAEIAAQKKAAETVVADARKALTELQAAQQSFALDQCKAMLAASLADSKLPVAAQKEVERRFAERVFTAEELKKEVDAVRGLFAAMAPEGRVMYPIVGGGLDSFDKMQIALDKSFGLTKDAKGADLPADIPAFKGLRHAYTEFTGDPDVSGIPNKTRISAILNNAGFPNALGNTMTRRLLKDYREVDYRWRELASSIASPENFKTQEPIRVGYLPDLATVDPEAADYAEIAAYTDEKVSYAVIQKGNILTVTRKAILNDDIGALTKPVGRLGRAAARTLARRVINKIKNNDTYDVDGLALFHATHNNLGSSALSVPALNAAALLVYNQTEKDSNEVLGLDVWSLWIPRALWEVAFAINNTEKYSTGPGIMEANPWFKKFGPNGERIIVSPLFTDTNDWYLFANPADVDILEVGFLQGRQEPEFFLADAIPAEQVFVADKIRYKIRHEYEAEILDFRGAFKAVVA